MYLFQISLSWCINVYVAKVNKCIKFVTWADFFLITTNQVKSTFLCLVAAGDSGDLGSSCLPVLSQFSSSLIGRKVWELGDLELLNFILFLIPIMFSFTCKSNQCQILYFLDSRIRVG